MTSRIMNRWSVRCGVLLCAALLLLGPRAASAERSPTPQQVFATALLNFETKEADLETLVPKINSLLSVYLSTSPSLMLVERSEIEKALSEQELGLTGTVNPQTVAQIGYLTGAKIVITGKVFSVENDAFIVAKIIGTETSRIFGETEKTALQQSPEDAMKRLAERIAATIEKQSRELLAEVTGKEDVIAKLKPLLQNKKLPTVSLRIGEHGRGIGNSESTAQSELGRIFLALGFQVVDGEQSRVLPDLEITGDAHSDFGMRKGNLISAKARLDIKVTERSSGRVIAVDRQTDPAIDLSEQVAGRTALEIAARKIAERVIPQMVP